MEYSITMKRAAKYYTVDFYTEDHPHPQLGDVIRDVSHTSQVRGYLRVLSVRQVQVRVSRGEVARYKLSVQRLEKMPPQGVSFTVHGYAPKKKAPLTHQGDAFSPLLPP